MATFTFGKRVDIRWQGYDIVGDQGTVFSLPDQLYEEFESEFRPVEPSLTWIDTNEFLTLQNAVSVSTLTGTFPVVVTAVSSGKIVSVSSSSALDGYVLTANGSGGVAWESLPADATGITNIIGTSPISAAVSGTQATISIDQTLITAAAAGKSESLVYQVKNVTGSSIPKGSAVYVSGATGDNALISLASASSDPTSSKTLGLTQDAIANDAFGYVVEAGYLTGIDTSSTTAGASVWLGTTPGSLTYGAPPAEPNHAVYLGVVIRAQQNNGSILVKVQNGYELDELHDVSAASPANGDALIWSSSSSMWQNKILPVTSVGGTSPIVASTNTATGAVSLSHQTSGVAANTYGSATAIPSIAVDATGHITSVTTNAISIPETQHHTFMLMGA